MDKKMIFPVRTLRKNEMRRQLDLVRAAEQHVLWKTRLGHHVHGRVGESLESGLVGQDGICQLGSWINGAEFHALRDTRVFRELSFAHSMFHDFGAVIMDKIRQGDIVGAESIYRNEYSQEMQHIIQALTKINQMLQES